jgi:hypothetical protein
VVLKTGRSVEICEMQTVAAPRQDRNEPGIRLGRGLDMDPASLEAMLSAATGSLKGFRLAMFLVSWVFAGRRPYPHAWRIAVVIVWCAAGASILQFRFLAMPEGSLVPLALVVFAAVPVAAIGAAVTAQCVASAWLVARRWRRLLSSSQVHITAAGFDLDGRSADLPGCLGVLRAAYEARPIGPAEHYLSVPLLLPALAGRMERRRWLGGLSWILGRFDDRSIEAPAGSWIWHNVFHGLRCGRRQWVSTGELTGERVSPVLQLGQKIERCRREPGVNHLAAPLDAPNKQLTKPYPGGAFRVHPLGSLRQVLLTRSGLQNLGPFRRPQLVRWVLTAAALAVFAASAASVPELACLVAPPVAPRLIPETSLVTDERGGELDIGTDATRPECFCIWLESLYWRAEPSVPARNSSGGSSAQLKVARRTESLGTAVDRLAGWVTIRRRRSFLGREYSPGGAVGRYSLQYISHFPLEMQ